jgi:hypothetical protein
MKFLTHLLLLLSVLVACSPVAVTETPTEITAEEGAALINEGRVTQIEVSAEWLYLQLDDNTAVRLPRADTPEGGLLAPFQPFGLTPTALLDVPIVPRE